MLWVILAIVSYILLAAVSLGDRKMLSGPMPDPKLYACYVGALGSLVLLLTPFLGFPVPDPGIMFVALLAGALFILGAYILYFGLHYFEASRIVPASGALTPIFTLLLAYLIFPDASLSFRDAASFALLIAGIFLLTHERSRASFTRNLIVAAAASWLFGSSFALAKFVYNSTSFWSGFLWMRIGGGVLALLIFLLFSSVRKEMFERKKTTKRSTKVAAFFLVNQALGAAAIIIQNGAVALAPAGRVAFVNALQGFQYAAIFAAEFLLGIRGKRKFDPYLLGLRAGGILTIAAGLTLFALR